MSYFVLLISVYICLLTDSTDNLSIRRIPSELQAIENTNMSL